MLRTHPMVLIGGTFQVNPFFVPPAEFDAIAAVARRLGFVQVVAGPFVRSSYHADEMVKPHADAHPAS